MVTLVSLTQMRIYSQEWFVRSTSIQINPKVTKLDCLNTTNIPKILLVPFIQQVNYVIKCNIQQHTMLSFLSYTWRMDEALFWKGTASVWRSLSGLCLLMDSDSCLWWTRILVLWIQTHCRTSGLLQHRELHLKPKWNSQSYENSLKNNISILKQIFWETQNGQLHLNSTHPLWKI